MFLHVKVRKPKNIDSFCIYSVCMQYSDRSSDHIFTAAVAVVCAVFWLAVAVFRCKTTAVAVVDCDEYDT